ncbi:hypothetical protein E2K93_07365 [Thalassotalea sp. HSM 43]|uniref:alpha-L-rhamnosidase-related protein n=1 Tax=Thalassotalea sp. HSM 43 TaxID=2552945 RepID=UPI001081656C|nr:alpha-L-rhamnosidase N-terminal domain-containing protein [Thalassotalea sp. HSM 43]QBY04216.1 hypothetical protein E2K93_07365 [Thalassotalea sp. HSM 43]
MKFVYVKMLMFIGLCGLLSPVSALENRSPLANDVVGLWTIDSDTKPSWQAKWIWHKDVESTSLALFRKSFTLSTVPSQARLMITASNRYKLYINGVYVNRGPARSAPHHQSYDVLDVASLLNHGDNVIAVQVHADNLLSSHQLSARAGLLLQLDMAEQGYLLSDHSVKTTADPAWLTPSPKMSRFHQQVNDRVDMRLALANWQAIDFDDRNWSNAVELKRNTGWPAVQGNEQAHAKTAPWIELVPRDIEYLHEQTRPVTKLVAAQYIDDYFATDNHSLITNPKKAPKVRLQGKQLDIDEQMPVLLSSSDKPVLLVYDFGEVINSLPEFTMRGSAGDVVEIIGIPFMIDDQFSYHMVDANLIDRVTLSGKVDRWQAQYFKPTRYLGVIVKPQKDLEIQHLALHQLAFPFTEQGDIQSNSAAWLNQYVQASKQTLKVATTDAYTDNYRERRQYAQTGFYAALGNYYTFANQSLQRRYLLQTAQEQWANGLMPAYGPLQSEDAMVILDSNCLWIRSLYNYYLYSGDKVTTLSLMANAERLMVLLGSFTNQHGLLDSPPFSYWLDHAKNDRRGANLNLNGHYLGAVEDYSRLRELLQLPNAQKYRDQAKSMRSYIAKAFWQQERGVFVDAVIDGKQSTAISEHGNAMALAMRIASPAQAQRVIAQVLDGSDHDYMSHANGMVVVTPAMSYFLHKGLASYGEIDSSLALFKQRFDKMLNAEHNGTLWEEWWLNGTGRSGKFVDNGRSRSDAQTESAFAPALFAEYVLGFEVIEPGMKTVRIRKQSHSIGDANATIMTPQGPLIIQWQFNNVGLLSVDIPDGVTVLVDNQSLGLAGAEQVLTSGVHSIRF